MLNKISKPTLMPQGLKVREGAGTSAALPAALHGELMENLLLKTTQAWQIWVIFGEQRDPALSTLPRLGWVAQPPQRHPWDV